MTTRVATYYRISADPLGLAEGVDRQQDDCKARIERDGWTLVDEYTENDTSASTSSRKPRPQYAQMLERARAGDYDVILSYSNSRLTRRPMELEDLIVLHERTGVHVRTIVSGDDDLSTADGRMVARIKASVDAAEAERTSERARRAKAAKKAKGEYAGGARRFGYGKAQKVTQADGRVILSATDRNEVNPRESELIRSGVAAVIAGNSVASVVKAWNASGIKGVRGAVWRRGQVRNILTEPDNVPKIIDAESLATVTAILNDNARAHTRGSEPKHFLSGIIECSLCEQKFGYYRKAGQPRSYRCQGCKRNSIAAEPVETVVSSAVAQWYALGKQDSINFVLKTRTIPEVNKELAAILDEQNEINERIYVKKNTKYKQAEPRLNELAAQEAVLRAELEHIRQSDAHEALSEAAVVHAEAILTADLDTALGDKAQDDSAPFARAVAIRERWEAMSPDSQKKLLAANFRVVVVPSHKGNYGRARVSVYRSGIDLTAE